MALDCSESLRNSRRFHTSQGAIQGLHQQAPKYSKIHCFHNRTPLPTALPVTPPYPPRQAAAKRLVLPPQTAEVG
jgi:hypothetical protein